MLANQPQSRQDGDDDVWSSGLATTAPRRLSYSTQRHCQPLIDVRHSRRSLYEQDMRYIKLVTRRTTERSKSMASNSSPESTTGQQAVDLDIRRTMSLVVEPSNREQELQGQAGEGAASDTEQLQGEQEDPLRRRSNHTATSRARTCPRACSGLLLHSAAHCGR